LSYASPRGGVTDHTFWFLTRASGLLAYVLLFGALSLGLSMTGDLLEGRVRRYRVYDLHRFLSLLALAVLLFHALIVLPDDYIGFSLAELLLPFASPYEPLYMGLGALSLYITALIVASFYAIHRIGYRTWRLLHYTTGLAFVLALVHGIGAGTDTAAAWVRYLYAGTGVVAFNLAVWRLLKGSARGALPRRALQARSNGRTNPAP
jgi:sulfoxide reductase heme-binding subunit YedZ